MRVAGQWDPSYRRDPQGGGEHPQGAARLCLHGLLSARPPAADRQGCRPIKAGGGRRGVHHAGMAFCLLADHAVFLFPS